MRLVTSDINWKDMSSVELKDETRSTLIVFEEKSPVTGTKICACDPEGNVLYFLDEDAEQKFDAFIIQKDAKVLATVTKPSALVFREIHIECKENDYRFHVMQGILQKDKVKAAKLIRVTEAGIFKVELYTDEDTEFILTLLYTIQLLL